MTSSSSQTSANKLDVILQRLKEGGMVIVVDAQERENEGDLLCAAEFMTPEKVDFMVRRAAGYLCAPLTQDVAERLQLSPIIDRDSNTSAHQTPFLIAHHSQQRTCHTHLETLHRTYLAASSVFLPD